MRMRQDTDILVWHYTSRAALHEMIKAGVIQTAFHYEGVREAVWFSLNGRSEPTARVKNPTIRIGVRKIDAPYTWEQFVTMSGISLGYASNLAKGADTTEWFVAFYPMPMNKWAAVQTWDDHNKGWIDIEIPTRSWLLQILRRLFTDEAK